MPITASMRSSGKLGVAEVFDADVLVRVECLRNAPGDGIQLDADEAMLPACAWLMKFPVPQPGSNMVALPGTPRRVIASWMAAITVGDV